MSDYDLDKVNKAVVKFDKYITMLRVKYGYTLEQAKKELSKHVAVYEAEQKIVTDQLNDGLLQVKKQPVKKKNNNKPGQDSATLKTEEQIFSGELFKNDSLGG